MDDRREYLRLISTVRRHLETRAELGIPQPTDSTLRAQSGQTQNDEAPVPDPVVEKNEPPENSSEQNEQMQNDKNPVPDAAADAEERAQAAEELTAIGAEASVCKLCPLHETRMNVVFGTGNPNADLMFVGEAPGRDEDLQGEPFVGRAGQLLTKIIEAMQLRREDVYIANLLKCRPPENRNPLPAEAEKCRPYLDRQIALVQPKALVALGSFAAAAVLESKERISRLRGRFHERGGVQVMPTYHPAYLLRNPSAKRAVWEDMQMVMDLLQIKRGEREERGEEEKKQ